MHGMGALSTSTGTTFEGEWANNTGHGLGVAQDAAGNKYEGQYAHNQYHGLGRSTLADGYSYRGEVAGGYFHGSGVFRSLCAVALVYGNHSFCFSVGTVRDTRANSSKM